MNFWAARIAFTYAVCMLMSISTFFPHKRFCYNTANISVHNLHWEHNQMPYFNKQVENPKIFLTLLVAYFGSSGNPFHRIGINWAKNLHLWQILVKKKNLKKKKSRIGKSNSNRRLTSILPVHANPLDHSDFGKETLPSQWCLKYLQA